MSSSDAIINQALQNRYQNVDKTRKEVRRALTHYKGMAPKFGKFVFNDGREKEFLNLDGTIPVKYKGSQYNIPICIWLLDNYPFSAPMVYVKPTVNMLIKSSRHVDQNGKVYLPYLHEWNPNSSDLMGLIQILIMTFAEVPPVYAKPKSSSPGHYSTPYPTQPPSSYMPLPSLLPTGTASSGSHLPYPTGPTVAGANPPAPTPYPTPYPAGQNMAPGPGYPLYPPSNAMYPQTPYPSNTPSYPYMPSTDNSSNTPLPETIKEEHIKASLISAVSDKVKGRLRDVYGGSQAEVSVLRQQQSDLNAGKAKLENLMSKLSSEQTELDKNIRILNEKHTEFESILSKMKEVTDPLDIDDAVTTTTPLYKKLLVCYSEDQATQDAIYYLGEALRLSVIDLDSYLKHVRSLSRKQFQLRATMNKCRSKANLPG